MARQIGSKISVPKIPHFGVESTNWFPSLSFMIANVPHGCFCGGPRNSTPAPSASLRLIAEETGLSKSAVQEAVTALQHLELIKTRRAHTTAVPRHRVLRHWRAG